jgi:hypothetical protein
MGDIKESDWKRLRVLQDTLLDRLCQRILQGLSETINRPGKTYHERYGEAYKVMKEGDSEVARMFDEMSRSTALLKLMAMRGEGLLTEEEVKSFSPELQKQLADFVEMKKNWSKR